MNDYKIMIPLLQKFGISPEQLGPDRFDKLTKMASKISNPDSITPSMSKEIMSTLGITVRSPRKPKRLMKPKIRPNDPCPCNSLKKYKKCCLISNRK